MNFIKKLFTSSSDTIKEVSKSKTGSVTFDHKVNGLSHGQPATYVLYKGPNKDSAIAFLENQSIIKQSYFVGVKTPEGTFCKDRMGLFDAPSTNWPNRSDDNNIQAEETKLISETLNKLENKTDSSGKEQNQLTKDKSFINDCFDNKYEELDDDRYFSYFTELPEIDSLKQSGDLNTAIELCIKGLKSYPDSFLFYGRSADIYDNLGKPEKAEEILKEGLLKSLSKCTIAKNLAERALKRNDYFDSIKWWIIACVMQLESGIMIEYLPFLNLAYLCQPVGLDDAEKWLLKKADNISSQGPIRFDSEGTEIRHKLIQNAKSNGDNVVIDTIAELYKRYNANVSLQSVKSKIENKTNEKRGSKKIDLHESIKIGNQEWMLKNLNLTSFRNGDQILEAKTAKEWKRAGKEKKPAWCYYDNDPSNGEEYGILYNFFAVIDPRGLAPEGWLIPSDEEWEILSDYLGGYEEAGGKLKESGTAHWKNPNTGATNETKFRALPGGSRNIYGTFKDIGINGNWWCATWDNANDDNQYMDINHDSEWGYLSDNIYGDYGRSVRCIRD